MIIRRKVNSNFTVVPNEPINDGRLTFAALGILTYLLSRHDNWTISIGQLQRRGIIGRDKAQGLVRDLIDTGYITRQRQRDAETNQFGPYEYVVYDLPQILDNGEEPQPENPVMGPQPEKPWPGKPSPENPVYNKDYKNKYSFREDSASDEAGADAPQRALEKEATSAPKPLSEAHEPPSVSAVAWKEALQLLSSSPLPEPKRRTLIGKWMQQAASDEAKEKFRAIIRAARKAGTGDPVAYITKALNEACPPPQTPEQFDSPKWLAVAAIAAERGAWAKEWGKPPGKKGCLMPPDMITPDLLNALAQGAHAA